MFITHNVLGCVSQSKATAGALDTTPLPYDSGSFLPPWTPNLCFLISIFLKSLLLAFHIKFFLVLYSLLKINACTVFLAP